VSREFEHIDVLINNAGMMMNDRQVNELGIEMTMAVNHFGHFLLTYLLFPSIKKSSEARIINMSSEAHKHTSLNTSENLEATEGFGSLANYSKSKLANVQFTVGLADRLSKYPHIKAMCLHPGIVDSDFATRV
jgi:NAD(P)-dependent dehydrogenase (short-subunit alcohol dehydrogenase family)